MQRSVSTQITRTNVPHMLLRYVFELLIALVIVAGVGVLGFYIGHDIGVNNPKEVVVKGITNIGDDEVSADFGVFWEAWKLINDTYLRAEEVDDQNRVYGAVAGMVDSLGDQNTIFLPPEESKTFIEDIKGVFGGIGAEIGIREDQLVIIAPLKDSPAEKAGLLPGDFIVEVDGVSTSGMNTADAVKVIRGLVGTDVVLTIFREGEDNVREITVRRDTIKIPSIDYKMLDGGVAYFWLHSFNENAPRAFYQEAIKAVFHNARGVVLDLRSNPGGFLEVAVDISGWFLKSGDIVAKEQFREEQSENNKIFRARGNEAFADVPVVVLLNQGSASASEILAGALRDNRNVKIVGEKSFGKGTVQQLQSLVDGSQLKITIAEWLLPNGETIEGNGIVPDVEVNITQDDLDNNLDPQLDKAIEVLRSEFDGLAKGVK